MRRRCVKAAQAQGSNTDCRHTRRARYRQITRARQIHRQITMARLSAIGVFALACGSTAAAASKKQPNIVYFLTDDQDQMLGGSFPTTSDATPMPQTRRLLVEQGATFTNMFVHTPICNPSRSELLTGRYLHNLKQTGGPLWAMHVDEEAKVHNVTFARSFADAGYTVGLFGKYLNVMPDGDYTPVGWDVWLANGGGNYISPQFATSGLADFGFPDGGWQADDNAGNYTTAVVGNTSVAWINAITSTLADAATPDAKPFFAYVAPKAAHEPFMPAPWYADHWDASWPEHEPRPIAYNATFAARAGHAGDAATNPMLDDAAAAVVTGAFRNRWRTLMSVDDVIAAVVGAVDAAGLLDETYFFYSSDHGDAPNIVGVAPSRLSNGGRGAVQTAAARETKISVAGGTPRPRFDEDEPHPHVAPSFFVLSSSWLRNGTDRTDRTFSNLLFRVPARRAQHADGQAPRLRLGHARPPARARARHPARRLDHEPRDAGRTARQLPSHATQFRCHCTPRPRSTTSDRLSSSLLKPPDRDTPRPLDSQVDLVPTWLELAGVKHGAALPPLDGRSLAPLLLDDGTAAAAEAKAAAEAAWRDAVYIE